MGGLLNGGTLAINSAFDKDEGDIGYLREPPPVPAHLFAFGMALLVLGGVLSLQLPAGFTAAYGACFLLSVLYSVPPFRFKAVAGVDWLINMIGFGTLTPYAGWALTGRPLDRPAVLVFAAFAPLFAALYPLTQLYQFEEDRRRGDRTLALMLGERASLSLAVVAAVLAFVLFVLAGVGRGWLVGGGLGGWRMGLLAIALRRLDGGAPPLAGPGPPDVVAPAPARHVPGARRLGRHRRGHRPGVRTRLNPWPRPSGRVIIPAFHPHWEPA